MSAVGGMDAAAGAEHRLALLEAELASVKAEFDDLNLLYQATIEHGEAVEDQLAEANLALQTTQKRLSEELTEAVNYIFSILPEPRKAAPRTDWLLVPSTELGGDSFGYHEIDADHMAFYLLDVCGHGVGAALLSVTAINVLRSAALPNTDFRDPGAVLSALNKKGLVADFSLTQNSLDQVFRSVAAQELEVGDGVRV